MFEPITDSQEEEAEPQVQVPRKLMHENRCVSAVLGPAPKDGQDGEEEEDRTEGTKAEIMFKKTPRLL